MVSLENITKGLMVDVGKLLEQPCEASHGLKMLRGQLEGMKRSIGRKAASEALSALRKSDQDIGRARQREIAEAIARTLKPLGVILIPGTPPKRGHRKGSAKPAAPTAMPASTTSESRPELKADLAPGGGENVSGLGCRKLGL